MTTLPAGTPITLVMGDGRLIDAYVGEWLPPMAPGTVIAIEWNGIRWAIQPLPAAEGDTVIFEPHTITISPP